MKKKRTYVEKIKEKLDYFVYRKALRNEDGIEENDYKTRGKVDVT